MPGLNILVIVPRYNTGSGYHYNPDLQTPNYNYYLPSGLAYIISSLKSAGYNVDVLNPNHSEKTTRDAVRDAFFAKDYDLVFTGGVSLQFPVIRDIVRYIREMSVCPVVVGGGIITAQPDIMFDMLQPDIMVIGEGEQACVEIAGAIANKTPMHEIKGVAFRNADGLLEFTIPRDPIQNLDALPFPDYESMGYHVYLDNQKCSFLYDHFDHPRPYPILASRSCISNCLSGDTTIDTTNGIFKIKDLVGQTPRVLTRDPSTKNVCYAQSGKIMKTGENKQLLRVRFVEGSYIDCTPEHKFTTFINGNGFASTSEYEVEAQFLRCGDRVRAVHYYSQNKYIEIAWGRKKHAMQHTLVMEAKIGRKLVSGESIHHLDHIRTNNTESNLILTDKYNHIPEYHQEVSQRMIEANPAKNLPHDHFVMLGKTQRGKVRSMESRLNYKASKTGEKNPMWKGGCGRHPKSRIPGQPDVNHVVESVTHLGGLHDTYCMEVPGYNWFYANDVLVHNCTFCFHTTGRKYRQRSLDNVMLEVSAAIQNYRPNMFFFYDELFAMAENRVSEFCKRFKELREQAGYEITFTVELRVDSITAGMLEALKGAGCTEVCLGLESYSQDVLDSMRKHITPAQIKTALELITSAGLAPVGNFIFGDTEETLETAKETLDFFKTRQDILHGCRVAFIIPFQGSQIYKDYIESGCDMQFIKDRAENGYDYHEPINMTGLSDSDFETLKDMVFTAHYTQGTYVVPDSTGKDSVVLTCPFCGKQNEYQNTYPPNLIGLTNIGCRYCNARFEMVSGVYMRFVKPAITTLGFTRLYNILKPFRGLR